MARKGIRVTSGEDFSPASIKKAMEALENGRTKKDVCAMLKMSYNTSRLQKVIDNFLEQEEFKKQRRKSLRGTAVTKSEKASMVRAFLSGESITQISEENYRSTTIIKNILAQYNIPLTTSKNNYFNPVFLECGITDDYTKDDLVYSARYNSPAYIIKSITDKDNSEGILYRIWILGDKARFAVQPWYELSDLRKIQNELNVKIEDMSKEDMYILIHEALTKANKLEKSK